MTLPTAPALTHSEVRLSFPPTSPSNIILLNRPLFGNGHELQTARINRTSRRGDRIIFRDASWPQYEVFKFQFTALNAAHREAMFAFLRVSLGKEIRLVDYEGRTWDGVITDPNAALATLGRGCAQAVEFTFRVTNAV